MEFTSLKLLRMTFWIYLFLFLIWIILKCYVIFRPRDSELNEFHPKATRTLHVGNISREVDGAQVHERFKEFGEILEIDIKKPDYALVQFVDIKSVINAIRNVDGEVRF